MLLLTDDDTKRITSDTEEKAIVDAAIANDPKIDPDDYQAVLEYALSTLALSR
jgi:TPP-dependent indolepyruvate ferredoxin oxidoreductase alpha subunit